MSSTYGPFTTSNLHLPKPVAEITICGAIHIYIDDTMGFIKPTPEQIKNLHDLFCIDIELMEGE